MAEFEYDPKMDHVTFFNVNLTQPKLIQIKLDKILKSKKSLQLFPNVIFVALLGESKTHPTIFPPSEVSLPLHELLPPPLKSRTLSKIWMKTPV